MDYADSSDTLHIREPRAIYVPIFDSFFESSIMHEDLATRFVMLALIRLAWRPRSNGIVDVDPGIFAASINVPLPDVERAIQRLMEPDPASGSRLEAGRRIVPIDPARPMRGWKLVNWADYKTILHKANDKLRKADARANADISDKTPMSPTKRDDTIRNDTKLLKRESAQFVAPSVEEVTAYANEKGLTPFDASYFVDFFEAKGWITGRSKMRSWQAAVRNAHRDGWTMRKADAAKSALPSGDVRLPTGGFAAADGSWFDYRGERYFGSGGTYRNAEGYSPDGTHKQNTAYTAQAREIADRILSPVLAKK